MRNLLQKKEKGFTLIEIVLVLAIAGLLLVIVFLALQGAQKSRRDTQRKEDAGRALAAMESCASNHAGLYPAACTTNLLVAPVAPAVGTAYFAGTDPANAPYVNSGAVPAVKGDMWPRAAACPGGGGGTASVQVFQESGPAYCVHN